MWCLTRKWVGCGEGVCESYKYLHLTGLWFGMMDRVNATDRNVYLIPHPSSYLIINSYPPVKNFWKKLSDLFNTMLK
jgi:hypothetical protein